MFLYPVCLSLPFLALVRAAPATEQAEQCSVTFDGRIPMGRNLADLDSSNTNPFRTDSTLGQGVKWSQAITYPAITGSYYDVWANAKPIEVTIDDNSIYNPSPSPAQHGLRRAELLPGRTGKALFTGKKTVHFSLQLDAAKPLNYSHEYQLFFSETADWVSNQLILRTGTVLDGTATQKANPKWLRLYGHSKTNKLLFETEFLPGWHNFAMELNFDKNTVKTYYSFRDDKLKEVTAAITNDLSGEGEFHFGVLKKPTGTSDILTSGYQEKRIDEGIIFGGVFIENGALDCSQTGGVGKRQDPTFTLGIGSTTIGFFPAQHEPNRPINWDKGPQRDDCGPAKNRWKGTEWSGSSIIWSKNKAKREALAYDWFVKNRGL